MEEEGFNKKNEKNQKSATFFDIIFFPPKLLGFLISFIFKFLKKAKKVTSVLLLLLFVWFSYNFYITFSELEERGVNREEAAVEAFKTNIERTRNKFDDAYKRFSSISFSFFTSEYSDEEKIREVFIKKRGIPEVYVIIISYDEIKEGVPVKRSKALRFETWLYGDPYSEKIVFENGFFKENSNISNVDGLVKNNVDPLFFNENTTKREVQEMFGLPSCTITESAGNDILTTHRFKETTTSPLMAVTFLNEKITAVSVGIVFLGDNENSLCK